MRIVRHPNGPRVYVFGLRVHHGSSGIAALVAGLATGQYLLAIAGIAAVAHDRRDFPWRDDCNH